MREFYERVLTRLGHGEVVHMTPWRHEGIWECMPEPQLCSTDELGEEADENNLSVLCFDE